MQPTFRKKTCINKTYTKLTYHHECVLNNKFKHIIVYTNIPTLSLYRYYYLPSTFTIFSSINSRFTHKFYIRNALHVCAYSCVYFSITTNIQFSQNCFFFLLVSFDKFLAAGLAQQQTRRRTALECKPRCACINAPIERIFVYF